MSGLDRLVKQIGDDISYDERVVVAMSGGVDSCLVAAAASAAVGERACGVTISSELSQERDVARALKVAGEIGLEHRIIETTVLEIPSVRANGQDRCYHCKSAIFGMIMNEYPGCMLLDGTNADDDPARPGRRAAEKMGVLSPLLSARYGKAMIREQAKERGLSNWDTPSESCLATRIKQGVPLSAEGLRKVSIMESFFHELGVPSLRVYHDNLVAIVTYMTQYADIIEESRDNFAALVERIGLLSFEFKEYTG